MFQQEKNKAAEAEDPHDDWEDLPSSDPVAHCIKRWRAAGPEERKKMFGMFDETGIFIVACRHAFVLWLSDMIRSGEL
jgi:hypothetical protein